MPHNSDQAAMYCTPEEMRLSAKKREERMKQTGFSVRSLIEEAAAIRLENHFVPSFARALGSKL